MQEVVADGGFAKHEDIEEIERECGGCQVYTPVPEPKDPHTDRYAPHAKDSEEVIRWQWQLPGVGGMIGPGPACPYQAPVDTYKITVQLKKLIPGWIDAVQQMRPGDQWMIYVPPSMGYGAEQSGPIPPNSVLVFKLELLAVGDAAGPPD